MIGTSLSTTVAYCAGRSYGVHVRLALSAAEGSESTTMSSTTVVRAKAREYMGPPLSVRPGHHREGAPADFRIGTARRRAQRDASARSDRTRNLRGRSCR